MTGLHRAYLLLYNVILAAGWASIGWAAVREYNHSGHVKHLFRATEKSLFIFQTAALLEVFNAAVGFVKSSTQNSWGYVLILAAWTVTEVIRYTYYAFNQLNMTPFILTYLRYTLFIVLYPMGVTGELICITKALPVVHSSKLYSWGLPNTWNLSFDYYYVLIGIIPLYVIYFPQLYSHMFRQRKKVLSPRSVDKESKNR
ncbi:Oidioi.mRNA.OKI2018_I69.XSR.g14132.t1.cds [Oikopleura dioica]|uniref:Very-long-chain (3R)-3-hydroxyacyl-CoA dehydratase n=1 Tax=Oikopleura dioica TaxID=34765 RepID=A0ABN7S8X5_OIKDI|nr:Oidioi.mRNA.OKI2018_I69.XSR.g14132.t1.cds [Oikopleura dioica]